VSQEVGTAWVGQISGGSMMLAWSLADGRQGAERMTPTAAPFGNPNHTQTWFSPGQDGWGLAIESLDVGGPFEFIGAFIYDAAGNPRWTVGSLGSLAGGNVPLIAHRPHCPACPLVTDWAADGQPAGSLQINYVNRASGNLSTAITLPAPFGGSWTRNALPIQPIAEPVP
jgi:hypothetical protein